MENFIKYSNKWNIWIEHLSATAPTAISHSRNFNSFTCIVPLCPVSILQVFSRYFSSDDSFSVALFDRRVNTTLLEIYHEIYNFVHVRFDITSLNSFQHTFNSLSIYSSLNFQLKAMQSKWTWTFGIHIVIKCVILTILMEKITTYSNQTLHNNAVHLESVKFLIVFSTFRFLI